MTSKTFGSLEKPKKRYVNKQVLRTYRARHEYCELCGGNEMFGTPSAGVHHIRFRSQQGDDLPENLIYLCAPCHGLAHDGTFTREYLQEVKNGEV